MMEINKVDICVYFSEEAKHEEVLEFIDKKELIGKGLGYIDIHLLASSILSSAPIWTFDRTLCREALRLNTIYMP